MAGRSDDNENAGRVGRRRLLGHLLTEQGSLKQKAVRSSIWVLLGNGLSQVATLARTVVLARLLSPNDFGLMAIATFALGGLNAFTQTGYEAALIHRPGDIRGHLNTVFSIQVLRGFLLAAILCAVAPVVGHFFKNPEAAPVVRAIGVAVVIQGFNNPAMVYFQKELNFKLQVFWNLSEAVTGLVVGIALAFLLRNVWALVGAFIAGSVVKTAMSFVMHKYRPRLHIDWNSARDLTRFGKWIFGTNMLAYLSTNLDLAVVGRILGTVGIGFYQTAYKISNLPSTAMAQIFSNVAFPLYSKLQTDAQKLRRVFFSGLHIAVLTGLPIALFFTVLAKPLTLVVLGEKWLPAVPGFQVLAFYGFFRMLAALGGVLFAGVGHPASDTKMNVIRFVALAVLVYPFTHFWGLAGASWAAVGSIAAPLPYWMVKCSGYLGISPGRILKEVQRTLMVVILGFAVPLAGLSMLLPVNHLWGFLTTAAAVSLVYSGAAFRWLRALFFGTDAVLLKPEESV